LHEPEVGAIGWVMYQGYLDMAAIGVQPDVDLIWDDRWSWFVLRLPTWTVLSFGDFEPREGLIRPGADGVVVEVAPIRCGGWGPSPEIQDSHGSACLEGDLSVNAITFSDADESRQKLRRIVEGLRLLEFRPTA
jgi:hypothetical protein